jgi:quinol monooxygenase YgiN
MPIKVVIDFQARPGQRDELKNVLAGISAAHGPTAPGFLGSTLYTTLDDDRLVEIAEWESAEDQGEAVQAATAVTMLGTSPDPFDQWYREHVRLAHGISLTDGAPTPEQLLNFDIADV